MYTRCTGCHTTHAVNAGLLARGGGEYRCGKCNKVCNALDALFDEWPGAGERPPSAGKMPVLGSAIDLEQARKSRLEPDGAALTGEPEAEPEKTTGRLARATWIVLALTTGIYILIQYTGFQEKSLADLPFANSVMTRLGILEPPEIPVFRDLNQIHLVSRELKSHPFRADILQLTATIVNRSRKPQPYPDLEVILLDAGGEEVSQVRFTPSDYLAEGAAEGSGMTPEAYLPLELDLPDPGNQAVGFELNFL